MDETMKQENGQICRNIEIKAKVLNSNEFDKYKEIAKTLSSSTGGQSSIIEQHDIFFNVTNGRMKLRYNKSEIGQLIQYCRPDTSGPKLSSFTKINIEDPKSLQNMLEAAIGIKGEVIKTRYLYIYQNTRIHLDDVKNLGYFLEFEVCLKADESIEQGQTMANWLLGKFGIPTEHLIEGAYIDELLKG